MKVFKWKPADKDELEKLIELHFAEKCYDLNDIDTSLITDMSSLFLFIGSNFNVRDWNTENVVNMEKMFFCCERFNCDISGWNVGKVKNMKSMFYNCKSFNQNLNEWDIRGVRNVDFMFDSCSKFNNDLSRWSARGLLAKNAGLKKLDELYRPKYYNLYVTPSKKISIP